MNQSLPETKQVKEKTSLDSDEEEASTAADIEKKTEGKTDRTTRRKSNERHIPALLRGMLGEATLCFVRGKTEDAIRICSEVIHLDPNIAESYRTLSGFYKVLGDDVKSFEQAFMAAQLSYPQNGNEWSNLAEEAVELEDHATAINCFVNAVRLRPKDRNLHRRRCEFLDAIGDEKKYISAKLSMFNRCPLPEEEDALKEQVDEAYSLAIKCHETGKMKYAQKAFNCALKHCSKYFSAKHFSLLTNTQLLTDPSAEVIEIVREYFEVALDATKSTEGKLEYLRSINFKENIPIDIQSKLCIALIHYDQIELAKLLILSLKESSVDDQIYLDVAQALFGKKHIELAVGMFQVLVDSSSPCMGTNDWLAYAKCLVAVNETEKAIIILTHAIPLNIDNKDLRIYRSEILANLGRKAEAFESLNENGQDNSTDLNVLYSRCLLLLGENRMEDIVGAVFKFLTELHDKSKVSKAEVYAVSGSKQFISETRVQWYHLFRNVADYLYQHNRYLELRKLTWFALTSSFFKKSRKIHAELKFIFLQAHFKYTNFFEKDVVSLLAHHPLALCVKMNTNRAWNFSARLIPQEKSEVCERFLDSLFKKEPNHFVLLLSGHRSLATGNYRSALVYYQEAFKDNLDNPLLALLLAITTVQIICQEENPINHSLVTHVSACLHQYIQMRGETQEAYYNAGRSFHQLGIFHCALGFYKRALHCKPSINLPVYDLRREIAFNMSLVYRENDSHQNSARIYLDNFIII